MVPYVDAVVAVTVMCVLLLVLHVYMLRGCEADGNAGMWMHVVVVSAGHMGGKCGIVSSTADVLWMSVVRGMRGGGGVCEMCMCLARSGIGVERVGG